MKQHLPLDPPPTQKVPVRAVIACAMEEELEPFLRAARDANAALSRVGEADRQEFYVAELAGNTVVLALTGMGLINAAVGATRILDRVDPEIYILAGTTGGLGTEVKVGDVVAGVRAKYSGADATAFGYQLGQIPKMPAEYAHAQTSPSLPAEHQGLIISGDSFVTAALADEVRERFPDALAVDMETVAAAQVCYLRGVPWISLRAVSDLCGPRAGEEFHIETDAAAARSFEAVKSYLSRSVGDQP